MRNYKIIFKYYLTNKNGILTQLPKYNWVIKHMKGPKNIIHHMLNDQKNWSKEKELNEKNESLVRSLML